MNTNEFDLPKQVVIYGWNLKNFPDWLWKLCVQINKIKDKDRKDIPPRFVHCGVAVFNAFYHYNLKGLSIIKEVPQKKEALLPFTAITSRTREEFNDWYHSPEITERFSSKNYNPGTNNCIHFATAACQFLGVHLEDSLPQRINEWLEQQNLLLQLFKSKRFRMFLGINIDGRKRTQVDGHGQNDEEDVGDDFDESQISWDFV